MKSIIAILGGGVTKGADSVWYSPDFKSGFSLYDAPGSRERVVAASFLWKENQNSTIIVLGGKGQMKNILDAPTLAEVVVRELAELGVPKEKIIEERESGTTYQQLLALAKITEENFADKIIVVSNRYHLSRVEAMVYHAPELQKFSRLNVVFQPAEDVLIKHDPDQWKESVDREYASPEMTELTKKEQNGVHQIREGTYKW